MNSLSSRLEALGVKLGARDVSPTRSRRSHPIEQVVQGRFVYTPCGETFVSDTLHPSEHRHGCCTLRTIDSLEVIAESANEPQLADANPSGLAFLDTETTGLGTGPGTYAFLVGVGRWERDSFHLAQFFMRDPIEEPALLAALVEFLQPCRALVTFNGKGFDVPLLTTRYLTNNQESPLGDLPHLDLLPLARRLWRDRLPSRSLGYLEQHVLGIARTQEDVPGWLIPDLYFDYLRDGDARPLKDVFYHNAIDILSMVTLLNHMSGLLQNPLRDPPNQGQVHALDLVAMAKLFETLGRVETALLLYERGLSRDLSTEDRLNAIERFSFALKRCGRMRAAIDLWTEAARSGQIYAHVELAKFYEHTQQDHHTAAHWTETAIELLHAPGSPSHIRERWLADLEHRLARLRRKQARQ